MNLSRDIVNERALLPTNPDDPIGVVIHAIDSGGGQTTDIYGVFKALLDMPVDARLWLATQLLHRP